MGRDRKEAAAPSEQGPAPQVLKQGKVQSDDKVVAVPSNEVRAGGLTAEDVQGKNKVIANPVLRGDVSLPVEDEEGNLKSQRFAAGAVHFVSDAAMEAEYLGTPLFVAAPESN